MSTETPFHRRHLPHFYPPDAIYFITFRLADSRIASLVAESIHYRDGKDYDLIAYILDNPLIAGLTGNRHDWQWSFSRFVL